MRKYWLIEDLLKGYGHDDLFDADRAGRERNDK